MPGKKSIHATHALIVMASQGGGRTISAAQLASHMGLSVSYLESLLKVLRENGLVRSVRGPGGGYELGMPAAQMSLWAVTRLFDVAEPPVRATASDRIDLDQALGDAMQAHAQKLLSSVFIGDHVQHVLPMPMSRPQLKWGFGFKPLAPRWLPEAPNSVFQLSEFMAQTTPAWAA